MRKPCASIAAPISMLIAAACIAGAWMTPVGYERRLLFFESTASMLDILRALADGGEIFVAVIVASFALLFPLAKLATLLLAWLLLKLGIRPPRALFSLLEGIGRWSMLDVFVAALVVATIKLQTAPFVNMSTGPAIAMLFGACVLTAFATWRVKRDAVKAEAWTNTTGKRIPPILNGTATK